MGRLLLFVINDSDLLEQAATRFSQRETFRVLVKAYDIGLQASLAVRGSCWESGG